MSFPRAFLLVLCLLFACGRGAPAPTETEPLEPVNELSLRLQAREAEARRVKTQLEADSAHSRFKIEADLEGLQERVTAAELALEAVRAADSANQAETRKTFNAALADLTGFQREIKARYLKAPR
ncbi:MAG: hypothetical protein IPP35_10540 [Elusimicrobia bacterium]|nr:hypothetical protein [Elusimicrobiota bacterium]